jgi:hypothetical protein
MKGELIAALSIIGTIIIVGLVLRYGATSTSLGKEAEKTILGGLQTLTLANPAVYPYEGPATS